MWVRGTVLFLIFKIFPQYSHTHLDLFMLQHLVSETLLTVTNKRWRSSQMHFLSKATRWNLPTYGHGSPISSPSPGKIESSATRRRKISFIFSFVLIEEYFRPFICCFEKIIDFLIKSIRNHEGKSNCKARADFGYLIDYYSFTNLRFVTQTKHTFIHRRTT